MMSKRSLAQFIEDRSPTWRELEDLLRIDRPLFRRPPDQISTFVRLYRELCTDRMRAASLGASPTQIHYLDTLTSKAHSALYHTGLTGGRKGLWLLYAFPQAFRRNFSAFQLSTLLFLLPFAVGFIRSLDSSTFAAEVLPLETMEAMTEAYAKDPSDGRAPGQNAFMAGFYVWNNVGIAFRCFATGILFGLGSAFFLIYNGAVTGAVFGHVIRTGGGLNILTFVSGHAPFELSAIMISGAAGLVMGDALLDPKGLTRLGSLWARRSEILALVLGAAVLLLFAAGIEGFFSPSGLSPRTKWAVGGALFVALYAYLGLFGRKAGATSAVPREPNT